MEEALWLITFPLLFHFLCRSENYCTKDAQFADSYETEVDGKNTSVK